MLNINVLHIRKINKILNNYKKRIDFLVNPLLFYYNFLKLGGPDGELGASLRYLSQRYSMPFPELKAILTDIGTEELAHLEMIGAIVYQLTKNLTPEEIKEGGMEDYFVDHTAGIYPQAASGTPYSAASMQSKGDTITDLHEDLAADENIL